MTRSARRARFTALYHAHHDFVWRALRRLGVADAATEDAAQEVWIVAYRHLDRLEAVATARPWLFTIARRIAWRQHRARARADRKLRSLARDPRLTNPPPDSAAEPERSLETAAQLERYLARLPEEQRRVFVLAELLSMTAREIGDALAINPATVYSRLRLARGRLDALLAADGAPERARLVAAMSRGDAPEPHQRRRTWAVVAPGLGAAEAPWTGLASWLLGGKGLLGGALAGALVGWVAVSAGPPRAPAAAGAARHGSGPPRERAPVRVGAPIEEPPRTVGVTPPASATPAARPMAERRARARRREGTTHGEARSLEHETALLLSARRALLGGRPARALELLERHAAEYPAGALREVRDATRAEVACALASAGACGGPRGGDRGE